MLCLPSKSIIESKVARNFPCILREQSEVLVVNRRKTGLVKRFPLRGRSMLKEEEERSAVKRRPSPTGRWRDYLRSIRALLDSRTLRHIVHKPHGVIEKVQALKKSTKYLGVVAVDPFSPNLYSVLAANNREIVSCVGAPKDFVNRGFKKKRLTKTECESGRTVDRTDICIRDACRVGGITRSVFPCISKMRLVKFCS